MVVDAVLRVGHVAGRSRRRRRSWCRSRRRAARAARRRGRARRRGARCRASPLRRSRRAAVGARRRADLGRAAPTSHAQRLRNQSVGSTCSAAGSGPALRIRRRRQRSSGRGLRVVGLDLPVAIVVEDARVGQLELALALAAPRVLLAQPRVGELGLRVVVAPAQPRRARRGVERTTSTPSRPRRDSPRCPVSPKMRSFRIGSRPFQNASARHMRCSRSQIPASPSSLQRYARERACSCGKYSQARPSAL